MIAAVVLGALAVRTVTAEYSTGMIRATFTAMPGRPLVLAAKAATVAAFSFPVALLSTSSALSSASGFSPASTPRWASAIPAWCRPWSSGPWR